MKQKSYDSALATVLRRKRAEAGLSQKEAGRRVGVTFQQLQKYEKGQNRVIFSRFVELASVYGTAPEQIMAEVREVLDAKAPETDLSDSRQSTELIRLANAVPRATLQRVLDLLRSVAKAAPDDRPS
jgi:transcriptional regulator with XRE-family HTH domain